MKQTVIDLSLVQLADPQLMMQDIRYISHKAARPPWIMQVLRMHSNHM